MHVVAAVDGSEHIAVRHAGGTRPSIDRYLHPIRHWYGADAAMLAYEIDDTPATIALLDMRERERRTSDRRSPQPRRTARMVRSRRPLTVVISGALRSVCACFSDSQLPMRMPTDFALLTRAIPAASSGVSSPISAASADNLRIADILMMIDDEPSPRASRDTRHALTVALVKPGRGACWNHARNSSSAMLYTRFVIGERDAIEHERLQFLPSRDLLHGNQIVHFGSF